MAYSLGTGLGFFVFYVIRLRRQVALSNIARSFPELTTSEQQALALKAYTGFGSILIEFCRYPFIKDKFRSMVSFEPISIFEEFRDQNKGAIVVSAHLGNWEMMVGASAQYGFPTSALGTNQRNPYSDRFIRKNREWLGIGMIPTGLSVRGAVKAIKEKRLIFFVADQDAGVNGVWVDFLGQPSSAPQGPALFHLKYGVPILICLSVRTGRGQYRVFVHKLPKITYSGNQEEDVQRITQAYYRVIEEYVRKYPEQWLWMHRRWKTRPPAIPNS